MTHSYSNILKEISNRSLHNIPIRDEYHVKTAAVRHRITNPMDFYHILNIMEESQIVKPVNIESTDNMKYRYNCDLSESGFLEFHVNDNKDLMTPNLVNVTQISGQKTENVKPSKNIENENELNKQNNIVIVETVDNVCSEWDDYKQKYMDLCKQNEMAQQQIERLQSKLNYEECMIYKEIDQQKQETSNYDENKGCDDTTECKVYDDECNNIQIEQQQIKKSKAVKYNQSVDSTECKGDEYEEYNINDDDILHQLHDGLVDLRCDINNCNKTESAEYLNCKKCLESMCEPLEDLTNDLHSEILQNALTNLSKSIEEITELQSKGIYKRVLLANMLSSAINKIDQLMCTQLSASMKNLKKNINDGYIDNMGMDLCEYIGMSNFDLTADFPTIVKIGIDKTAVIEYKGYQFMRNMSDFKWLWRVLLIISNHKHVVPEYPVDIQTENLWDLRKRRNELNLFLMQCHSLPWIKKFDFYEGIFLEIDKNEWKRKKNEFNKNVNDKLKNN